QPTAGSFLSKGGWSRRPQNTHSVLHMARRCSRRTWCHRVSDRLTGECWVHTTAAPSGDAEEGRIHTQTRHGEGMRALHGRERLPRRSGVPTTHGGIPPCHGSVGRDGPAQRGTARSGALVRWLSGALADQGTTPHNSP